MELSAIAQQPVRETQITGESRNVFQAIADKFVAVVNSCKTFSTGCSTQKDHNIQKACERLVALTQAEPKCYITDAMKRGAEQLGITLPDSKVSVSSKADISGVASIDKLSVLKTTKYSAQELNDMLGKQLEKPGTSQEMREKIQIALGKADIAITSDVHTKMLERGVNKLTGVISADILKEHRRNEMGGGAVLDSDTVKELEKLSNSLSL